MIDFIRRFKSIIISFIVGLVFSILILLMNGGFKYESTLETLKDLCDAFSISGFLMIAMGLMIWIGNDGTFSILSFGVKKFISLFKKNVYMETFYDYKKRRLEKKSPFKYLLISGGILFLVGIIFLVLFYIYR